MLNITTLHQWLTLAFVVHTSSTRGKNTDLAKISCYNISTVVNQNFSLHF